MPANAKLAALLQLIRFDKPIGTLLLLWPTLGALWIAAGGLPDLHLLLIFIIGTFLMRSAGCIINDLADRKVDGAVERTRTRPLVTGAVTVPEARVFFFLLLALAFVLVLFTDPFTIKLSFVGVALAAFYPFMKRYTHLPQLVLGAAFSWGIPMAFSAQSAELPVALWGLFLGNVIWTVVYDTMYAMADREDDLKVGIKSSAILFGDYDRLILAILQSLFMAVMIYAGAEFSLGIWYYLSLAVAAGLMLYHQYLIRERESQACFKAFLHNKWVGLVIFAGIALDYAL